jgi:phosphatidylinositol kinase/protein kinase (PI-3  family)
VDNLFIFKKQFTKYHAINSFFSYIFNQNEQLRLSTLVFCKASGKFNFTDAKLSLALQKKDYYRNRSFKEIDEELFKNTGQRSSQNEIDNMLPFRLTPNLVHFIGKIGLEGLFAGVMTSASLALSSQE